MLYRDFMKLHMVELGKINPCNSSKYRLIKIGILWQFYKIETALTIFKELPFNI